MFAGALASAFVPRIDLSNRLVPGEGHPTMGRAHQVWETPVELDAVQQAFGVRSHYSASLNASSAEANGPTHSARSNWPY